MSLGRFLSDVCDGIPVVGHIKGVIHDIAGDEEKAKKSYMSATRSSLVLGGGALGSLAGPVGAAAMAAYTGALTDTVASAVTKKPVGFVKNVERLREAEDLGDVIVGVGRMSLDIGLDATTGVSAGSATKSIARQSTKQLLKSAPKQAAKEAARQATGIGRQAVRHAAVELVTNMQKPRRRVDPSDDDPSTDLDDVSSSESSSSSEEDEDEGFIYFFTCPDGSFKVGRTGRMIDYRLNEHRRKGLIGPNTKIKVYECPRNVTQAETRILSDYRIHRARRIRQRRTEILNSDVVSWEYVDGVIKRAIAEVNNISESRVRTFYFCL